MKVLKVLGHVGIVLAAVFLLAVLPVLTHFNIFSSADADAVSSASIVLPDQPSGEFLVLMKTSLHRDTVEDWADFAMAVASDSDELPLIFEDISCITADGDVTGQQLAERYQIALPENQMTVRSENSTLLVSKVEAGRFDVAIFSSEMADALELDPDSLDDVTVIRVAGEG